LLNDEVRPQKVVVEAPFVYGTRDKISQRASFGNQQQSMDSPKSNPTTLKSQLSLPTHPNPVNDLWSTKAKKKQRQNSNSCGNQNNHVGKKPGRPKRDVRQRTLSCC
jgi:hypothetical protein